MRVCTRCSFCSTEALALPNQFRTSNTQKAHAVCKLTFLNTAFPVLEVYNN
ncbi:MAG: hypothetical protein IJ647_10425 [Prevotella sp.]|nr:hypothetical protein [Prevotella sp.]